MSPLTYELRLLLTFVLSFVFGLARQRAHKPIGFGTFTMVATGACGLAITALLLTKDNPLPLLNAIITGIGFLGAGALVRTSEKIFGFTSATSIWLFAVIGLVLGIGEYLLGLTLYLIAWLVIVADYVLAHHGIGSYQRKVVITASRLVEESEVDALLAKATRMHKLIAVGHHRPQNTVTFTYLAEGTQDTMTALPAALTGHDWFDSCTVE
ncbi:MAG: MgtC/SapB family protein [Acidobacteria bacterium]|nr:MgtC/SapB family protein [Acidobacteriota bacterium]